MLRLGGARVLDERDSGAVLAMLGADPVAACMVAARVESAGTDRLRLGGELWGLDNRPVAGGRLGGLCFAGPNLIPLAGDDAAIRAFASRALRHGRMCSSLVGPSDLVLPLWSQLRDGWGPAREVRADQPLLATAEPPHVSADPRVRQVRPDELDMYLPAAIAMFTEEVGLDPTSHDGGVSYRARIAELISGGRAFARFENGHVVFKAEIGALSSTVGQIQGVWVAPGLRGHGLGRSGVASVTHRLVRGMGRTASLYVNVYNLAAVAAYRRIGFRQVGCYATVLF